MGKKDGFLLYERQANRTLRPKERIRNFDEFHPRLPDAERRRQAARCMNCGVPFCQSGVQISGMFTGCPLHNLIPEWNDMLYLGNARHALDRLLKTNCFPEFTGRVCPALCEAACTCGLYGDSVTVRENELSIIEKAFAKGWMAPHAPEVRTDKRVAIVGSGPSGLAAAQMLNQRGHHVTVYERADRPGGLLMYGIPNMKLDKSVVARRVEKMRQEGVEFITNVDVGAGIPAESLVGQYDAVLLCCGAGKTARSERSRTRRQGRPCSRSTSDVGYDEVGPRANGAEAVSATGKDVVMSAAATPATTASARPSGRGCKLRDPA